MSLARKTIVSIVSIGLIIFAGSWSIAAQDARMSRHDFLALMQRSEGITGMSSYRRTTVIETGTSAFGTEWTPYSSSVEDAIPPDRSRLIFTSRIPGEYLRIGRNQYRKEKNGSWTLSENEAQGRIINPASTPGFNGPVVEYCALIDPENDRGKGKAVRVVSKLDTVDEKKAVFYTYWFNEKGIVIRIQSIAFSEDRFIRRTENIENDPNIAIETPK